MHYLCNAFSIQMLSERHAADVRFERIHDAHEAMCILTDDAWTNAIGHADTARVVSNMMGLDPLEAQRVNVELTEDDMLIVAQVTGGRLPEGATTLPEGVTIQFWEVKIHNESEDDERSACPRCGDGEFWDGHHCNHCGYEYGVTPIPYE